jgi:hypothetical protein
MKKRVLPFFTAVFVFLISCSARIDGTLQAGGSAELALRASLEPRMTALIRSLSRAAGDSAAGAVIDGPAIARSMAASPGIRSVSFRNENPGAIAGTIAVSRVDEFLSPPENRDQFRFVRYEQEGSRGRLTISLDRDTGPQLVALISEDVADYLSALMAPVATGEILSRTEYLGLVASVYGQGVADEIAAARVQLTLTVPGTVRHIRGGAYSGRQGVFDIPLAALLVLDTPMAYEIGWE